MVNDATPTITSTTSGRTYAVSAYVRATGVAVKGKIRIREVDGGAELATFIVPFTAGTGSWTRVDMTYTSTATGAKLDLNVVGRKVDAGAALLVDDLSMKRTTSTATATPSSGSPSASPSAPQSSSSTPTPSASTPTSPTSSATSPMPTPTPTPTPPPSSCVSDPMGIPAPGITYLGAAVGGTSDLATREANLGSHLALHRTYYQANQIDRAVTQAKADLAAGRLPWISFKEPLSWADMAAGKGNTWAQQLADALATVDGPIWLAIHHEPENDGDLALWTEMQRQIAPIIHTSTNNVAYTVIYSGWNTFGGGAGGGNTIATKWPGDDNIDILAVDAYNPYGTLSGGKTVTKTLDLSTYFTKMATWSQAHGTAWALGETGQTNLASAVDPTWIQRSYQQMVAQGGAGFSYFDSSRNSEADWTLDDTTKFTSFKSQMPASAKLC